MPAALAAVNPGTALTSANYASTFSNGTYTIDKTGTTDSWNAFAALIAAVAGTNTELVIDCPILLTVGTQYARQLFLPSGIVIRFTYTGKLITDATGVHLFNFQHASDVTFINANIQYIGTFGTTMIDVNNPASAVYTLFSNCNDVTTKAYLAAGGYNGTQFSPNTFSGNGSSISPGSTNECALFNLQGNCDRIQFLGKTRIYVPQSASAYAFIPVFMSMNPQWTPGTAITSTVQSIPPTSSTAVGVGHVYFEDLFIDGCLMGIVGSCRYFEIGKIRSVRYSDLQDANGNNVGGQFYNAFSLTAAPASPYTSATLASGNWAYSTSNYLTTFSDGSTRTVTFTNNSSTISWTGAVASGLSSTIQVTFSNYWFAPPHLLYLHQFDLIGSFPMTINIYNYFDEAVYVGTPNRRSINSGYLTSMKIECANGTVIDGATSLRPDGMIDFLSFNGSGGTLKNFYSQVYTPTTSSGQLVFAAALSSATSANLSAPWQYGSGSQTYTITFSNGTSQVGTFTNGQTLVSWPTAVTATATASVVNTSQNVASFHVRFPSSPPIQDVFLDIEGVDTASVPTGFPFLGDVQALNTGVTIKSKMIVQDWPGTYVPGFAMGGTNINIDSTIIFNNCSSSSTYIGSAENTGSTTIVTESNYKLTLVGWRATALSLIGVSTTFTAAPAYPYTSATLSTGNWAYATAYYNVTFSDGSVRSCYFVNGSSTVSFNGTVSSSVTSAITIGYLPSGATSATLSSNFAYATGTYTMAFGDGEQRQVSCTNNSTAISWTGGLSVVTVNSAQLLFIGGNTNNNFDAYKNRVILMQSGLSYSNRFELIDATNGYRALLENGLFTEELSLGCLISPTGATYTAPLTFPNNFSIVGFGYKVNVAFTGATGLSIGDSNSATRFVSNGAVTNGTNNYTAYQSPIALVNSPTNILLTGVGGSLASGTLYMALKGVRVSMAG